MRGATVSWARKGADHDYFNPRSPCGERHDSLLAEAFPEFVISIHAPRAGSDVNKPYLLLSMEISIHAPRAGSDFFTAIGQRKKGISIHAPRAGSDGFPAALMFCATISIHAPRAGSDAKRKWLRGEIKDISIHAPRAGSDNKAEFKVSEVDKHFNPRSPCGERQQYIVLLQVQSAIYTQSAILSIVNAIKGRRLLIEFGAKACGISCVLQIRTHKTSGSSTEIVSFEP